MTNTPRLDPTHADIRAERLHYAARIAALTAEAQDDTCTRFPAARASVLRDLAECRRRLDELHRWRLGTTPSYMVE